MLHGRQGKERERWRKYHDKHAASLKTEILIGPGIMQTTC